MHDVIYTANHHAHCPLCAQQYLTRASTSAKGHYKQIARERTNERTNRSAAHEARMRLSYLAYMVLYIYMELVIIYARAYILLCGRVEPRVLYIRASAKHCVIIAISHRCIASSLYIIICSGQCGSRSASRQNTQFTHTRARAHTKPECG